MNSHAARRSHRERAARKFPAITAETTEALDVILEALAGVKRSSRRQVKPDGLFTISDGQITFTFRWYGLRFGSGSSGACAPSQPVVVIDGDGAALMKMGSMATIGFYQPENFLHIVLDNEAHDSTGGQQTASPVVRFADVAAAANYRSAFTANRREDIRSAVRELRQVGGRP